MSGQQTTLDRKFLNDVTLDLTLASGWTPVNGVQTFAPDNSPTIADTTASDTDGNSSGEITVYDSTAKMTVFRRIASSVYDPGQELIRGVSKLKFGTAARIGLRWYDRNGGPETGKGIYLVKWARSNSGSKNVEMADITFTNTDGAPTLDFTNPFSTTNVPVIVSALPSGAAVGSILLITGAYFTGVTGASHVTIGGTNASSYTVLSDSVIAAVMPAGSAGPAAIVVTNANGASASFSYTRGA